VVRQEGLPGQMMGRIFEPMTINYLKVELNEFAAINPLAAGARVLKNSLPFALAPLGRMAFTQVERAVQAVAKQQLELVEVL